MSENFEKTPRVGKVPSFDEDPKQFLLDTRVMAESNRVNRADNFNFNVATRLLRAGKESLAEDAYRIALYDSANHMKRIYGETGSLYSKGAAYMHHSQSANGYAAFSKIPDASSKPYMVIARELMRLRATSNELWGEHESAAKRYALIGDTAKAAEEANKSPDEELNLDDPEVEARISRDLEAAVESFLEIVKENELFLDQAQRDQVVDKLIVDLAIIT